MFPTNGNPLTGFIPPHVCAGPKDFQSNWPQNESQIGPKNKNKKRINK